MMNQFAPQHHQQHQQHQHQSPVTYMPLGQLPTQMQVSNPDMQFPIYPTAFALQGANFMPELGVNVNGVQQQGVHNGGFTMDQESMEQWPGNGY